jgi:hypothetical protein
MVSPESDDDGPRGQAVRGEIRARLAAIARYHPVGSDQRGVSASGESHRVSSGLSTLRFRDSVRPHRLWPQEGESRHESNTHEKARK